MSNINNKAERHKHFCVAQLMQEAKNKLSFRDYVALCELLKKIKNVKRQNNPD